VAAYSLWVNGLVEGTNKLLLHILKKLYTPNMEEDREQQETSWDKLPVTWLDHLDDVVHALNHHEILALKFSPKELLLGLMANTLRTLVEDSASTLRQSDVLTQMVYVEQQCLDSYEETVHHALKRKAVCDKRILQQIPGEVIFKIGQLVQVYRNDLDYTFTMEWKLIPKWLVPRRIQARNLNLYKLEMLEGRPIQGEFSMRQL
jgi:hypothetical protein